MIAAGYILTGMRKCRPRAHSPMILAHSLSSDFFGIEERETWFPDFESFTVWPVRGQDRNFPKSYAKRKWKPYQRVAQTSVWATVSSLTEKTGLFRCKTLLPNSLEWQRDYATGLSVGFWEDSPMTPVTARVLWKLRRLDRHELAGQSSLEHFAHWWNSATRKITICSRIEAKQARHKTKADCMMA